MTNVYKIKGPLLARKKFWGAEGKFSPYVSDGDTARVLFFMNMSGAYGGFAGQDQAMKDAIMFAAGPELLDALVLALPYVECSIDDDAYKAGSVSRVIAKMRAAIAKAEGRA